MTLTAWRIYKAKYAATAFSGEGARRFGGRWNSKGVALVYVSSSISLASLEMLVHLQSADVLNHYVVRSATFDHILVRKLAIKELPKSWRDNPPPAAVQRIGDAWVARADSPVLQVPSAVIESESNFLLNVAHPDFRAIELGAQQGYAFDPRPLKS